MSYHPRVKLRHMEKDDTWTLYVDGYLKWEDLSRDDAIVRKRQEIRALTVR